MEEMTSAEVNQYLEVIAKLIESSANDVQEAANIVRDAQIKA